MNNKGSTTQRHKNLDETVTRLQIMLEQFKDELVLTNRVSLTKGYIDNKPIKDFESESTERFIGLITSPYANLVRYSLDYYELEAVVNHKLSLSPYSEFESPNSIISIAKGNMGFSSFDIYRRRISSQEGNLTIIKSIKDFSLYFNNENVEHFILENYGILGKDLYARINELLRDPKKLMRKEQEDLAIFVIKKLDDLLKAERECKKQISSVYDSIGKGIEIQGEHIEIMDENDVVLCSWLYMSNLKSVRKTIKKILKEAIRSGLHHESMPYVHKYPNGKVTKTVSEFILELNANEKYRLPKHI